MLGSLVVRSGARGGVKMFWLLCRQACFSRRQTGHRGGCSSEAPGAQALGHAGADASVISESIWEDFSEGTFFELLQRIPASALFWTHFGCFFAGVPTRSGGQALLTCCEELGTASCLLLAADGRSGRGVPWLSGRRFKWP